MTLTVAGIATIIALSGSGYGSGSGSGYGSGYGDGYGDDIVRTT